MFEQVKQEAPKNLSDLGYKSPKEFVDALDKIGRSRGYIVIRDLTPQMVKEIKEDVKTYQLFQDIRIECKKSHDYDHSVPIMLDVNRAALNVYTLLLNLLKANKSDTDAILGEVCLAINKIEEKIGLEKTDWNGGSKDVTDNAGDVQSIPPDSDGVK